MAIELKDRNAYRHECGHSTCEVLGAIAGGLASAAGGFGLNKLFGGSESSGTDAATAAALQMGRPLNVSGAGLGTTKQWGKAGTRIAFKPSKRLGALQAQFGREATGSLDEQTREMFDLMNKLNQRDENRLRRSTKRGLYSLGRLGTKFGAEQIGEVEAAIQDARLNRFLQARTTAFNERQGAFQNYLTSVTEPYRILGGLGLNRNPAALAAAQSAIQSGLRQDVADERFRAGIGEALQPAVGAFSQWAGDQISSIFNTASTPSYQQPAPASEWAGFDRGL